MDMRTAISEGVEWRDSPLPFMNCPSALILSSSSPLYTLGGGLQ